MKYRFEPPLREGLIRARPNRFIMEVELQGWLIRAHCPSTGRIGNLHFQDIPCLLSLSADPGRTTGGTVEAISLDPMERKRKRWIGIDQGRANDYIDHFVRQGLLAPMIGNITTIEREVKLGNSRIDFRMNGRDYVEVKTPLNMIDCSGHPQCQKTAAPFLDFERIIKHFHDIAASVGAGSRAIMLMCFLYDAPVFAPPMPDRHTVRIQDAAREAAEHGVEFWQVNLRIDREGVDLSKCFKLDLFAVDEEASRGFEGGPQ
jgi:sugar fermentation stimulation protein A